MVVLAVVVVAVVAVVVAVVVTVVVVEYLDGPLIYVPTTQIHHGSQAGARDRAVVRPCGGQTVREWLTKSAPDSNPCLLSFPRAVA